MEFKEITNKVKTTTVAVAKKAGAVANKAGAAAKDLGKKAGNVIEEGKLQAEIKERKNKINENFSALGHILYDCGGKLENNDYVISVIHDIDMEFGRIVELNRKIADMKGQNYCIVCGKSAKKDKRFCPNCGTAFKVENSEE